MAENNVAEIEIKTVDNTEGGFKSVATRFQEFDEQVGNLEKNLRPIQEILNAGLSSSAAVAGIAACTSSAGNLSGAFSALQSSFLGIEGAASEMGGPLEAVSQKVLDCATSFTKFFGVAQAAFEVGKQVKVAVLALNTVMEEQKAITEAVKATRLANTASAVTETATQVALATAVATETTAENANVIAKKKNIFTTTALFIASSFASVTMATLTGAVWLANSAWAALNITMALNPIVAIVAGITALAAAVALVVSVTWRCVSAGKSEVETALESAEAFKKKREALEKNIETHNAYAERLKLLQEKEELNTGELAESRQIVSLLNDNYRGLNLTLDETTGKVKNAAGKFVNLRKIQAQETVSALEKESNANKRVIRALKTELNETHNSYNPVAYWTGKENKLQKQIEEATATQKEINQKLTEARNALTTVEVEAEREKRDALKATAEVREELLKEIENETKTALEKELEAVDAKVNARDAELQKLVEIGKLSAEQAKKEMDALKAVGEERKTQLIEAERLRTEEERARKMEEESLRRAEEAQKAKEKATEKARKEAEEEARNQAEITRLQNEWSASERKRKNEEKRKSETEAFSILLKANPVEAVKTAAGRLSTAKTATEEARAHYEKRLQSATADGKITDAERKILELAKKRYDTTIGNQDHYQTQYETAKQELEASIKSLMEELAKPTGPVEAMTRGSVEAFRKEFELDQLQQSPEVAKLANIEKILTEKFAARQKTDEETRDYTKKIAENLVGV
ncbi:MAG: hypothetical protein Q4C70_08600 [Planctomycetia bacterium]|nr:hypothetical protein [Planctomycetia bacterium]